MRASYSPRMDTRSQASQRSHIDSKPIDCFTGQQHRRSLLQQGKSPQQLHLKRDTDTILSSPKAFSHIESDSLPPPVWLVPNEEGVAQRQASSSPIRNKLGLNRFEIPEDETIIVIPEDIQFINNYRTNNSNSIDDPRFKLSQNHQTNHSGIQHYNNNSQEASFANIQLDSVGFEEDFQKSIIHKTDSRFIENTQIEDQNQYYSQVAVIHKNSHEFSKDSQKYRNSRYSGAAKPIEMAMVKNSPIEGISAAAQTTSEYKNLSGKEDNNNNLNTIAIHTNNNQPNTTNQKLDSPSTFHNGISASFRAKNKERRSEYLQQLSMSQISGKPRPSGRQSKQSGIDIVFSRLNLLRLTWKFIDSLRKNSRILLYKRLKQHHFRVINDKSSFSLGEDSEHNEMSSVYYHDEIISPLHSQKRRTNSTSSRSFFGSFPSHPGKRNHFSTFAENFLKPIWIICKNLYASARKQLVRMVNAMPTISPDNPILLLWNVILLISIVFLLFFIPIQCAFDVISPSEPIDFASILLFAIDGFLKLNTGFFKDGEVVSQRSKIFVEQSKHSIWFNIGTIALFNLENQWRLLFIINTVTLKQLIETFDSYFQIKQRFYILYEIVKLVFIVCFIASTFGSIFFMISEIQVENGEKNAWILTKPINSWEDGYIYGLYFMFITMSTVGYGDLVPQNRYEVIYTALITLMGSCVFAYCINSIGNLLSEISNRESFFKQRMNDVMAYLRTRNISRGLQVKVMRYLEYLQNIESSQSQLNSNDVLKYFSENLKFELNKEFFGKILKQSKVFGLHFTPQFLSTLAQSMRETTLAPGDILYHKNQTDNRILFLTSGDIELFEKEVKLRTIERGEMLNYRGFFGNLPHSSSARSLTISHVSYCLFDDFVELLRTFPQDYETFCFMRDEVNIYNRSIDSKCCSCQSFSHVFQECPLIHYRLNKDTVLRRWNYSENNLREQTFTRRSKRGKSLLNLLNVKTKLKQYKVTLLTQMEDFSYLEGNDLTEDLTDKQFYKHLPSIKVSEDGFVYQESDLSNQTDQSNFSLEDQESQDNEQQQQQQFHESLTFDFIVPSDAQNNSSSPKAKAFQSSQSIFKNAFVSPSLTSGRRPSSEEQNNNNNNNNQSHSNENKGFFPQISGDSFKISSTQLKITPQTPQISSDGIPSSQLIQLINAKSLGRPSHQAKVTKQQSENGTDNLLEQQLAQFSNQQLQQLSQQQQQQQQQSQQQNQVSNLTIQQLLPQQILPIQQQQQAQLSNLNMFTLVQQIVQQLQYQQQQQQLTPQQPAALPLFGMQPQQMSSANFLPLIHKASRNYSQQDSSEIKSNCGTKQQTAAAGRPPSISYGHSKHLQRQHTGSSRAAQFAGASKSAYTSQVSSTFKAAMDKSVGFNTDSKDSNSQHMQQQQQQPQPQQQNQLMQRSGGLDKNNIITTSAGITTGYQSNAIARLDVIRNNVLVGGSNLGNVVTNTHSFGDNFLIIMDFDILKEFSNYFPHNNSSNVIKQNQALFGRNRRMRSLYDRPNKTNKLIHQPKSIYRKSHYEQSPFSRNQTPLLSKDKRS